MNFSEQTVAALGGGLLAVIAAVLAVAMTQAVERGRWRRDAQLAADGEVLAALQQLVRRVIDVAELDEKPQHTSAFDDSLQRYHEATIRWNTASQRALLTCPVTSAEQLNQLDREIDSLVDLAMSRTWTRTEFRAPRIELGRLAAAYLATARETAGLKKLHLHSIWAWDQDGGPETSSAVRDAASPKETDNV